MFMIFWTTSMQIRIVRPIYIFANSYTLVNYKKSLRRMQLEQMAFCFVFAFLFAAFIY